MLQFYDKLLGTSALAIAALAAPVFADIDTPCDLSPDAAAAHHSHAAALGACANVAPGDAALMDNIHALTERHREKVDTDGFQRRDTLDAAAAAHAHDMAIRGYAAHRDPEGRTHLDRIRTLDRTVLIGAAGANIAAGRFETAGEAFNALISDANNRENLSRRAFSHAGVGAATAADGTTYVVQLFAQVDGELAEPLPRELPPIADLEARFADAGFSAVGWSLVDDSGRTLDRGYGDRLHADISGVDTAYLTIEVARAGGDSYALKGPRVSGR